MLSIHSNSTINHSKTFDPESAKGSVTKVDLKDFNNTLNQVNNGNSDAVAQEMLTQLDRLVPQLEEARIAAQKSLPENETQGSFKLKDGTEVGFVASKVDSLVSYFPKTSSGEIGATVKTPANFPFGYITAEEGKIKSADMWTPKSQRSSKDAYQRIGIRKSPDGQFKLEAQLTFSQNTEEIKESLRLAQKVLASNPQGELALEIPKVLQGASLPTQNGRSYYINDIHRIAA
jgi:hypothetical protein